MHGLVWQSGRLVHNGSDVRFLPSNPWLPHGITHRKADATLPAGPMTSPRDCQVREGCAMSGKRWGGLVGVALLVGLCAAPAADAGAFIGYWGWHWNPAPDCPHPMYPPKHYWCVGYYKLRAWVNPSYLDQY